ncbi:hypothetical protein Ancab_018998 [Ancistrocladus abbreviatus]
MAAGRYRGYHDTEFAGHEPNYDMPRRDLACSKDKYDQVRSVGRIRGRDVRGRDRVRIRQKDVKEREIINGRYRSSSSRSDSGSSSGGGGVGGCGVPRRCGYSVKLTEREPGELSSESGSDGAVESESQVKNSEVSNLKNGIQSLLHTRKRKFSPIVWDRDEKEVRDLSKIRTVSATTIFCPAPSLLKSDHQSAIVVPEEDGQLSPVRNSKVEYLQTSPVKIPADLGSMQYALSDSAVNLPHSSPLDQQWLEEEEVEQLEDEEYIPTRNISSSRWAGVANSPADEGEISDDVDAPNRGRMKKRSSSADLVELRGEGSDGVKVRSSDSEVGRCSRPSSGDCSVGNILDKNDDLEVDDDHNSDGASLSRSDTDSDNDNNSQEIPEPPGPPQRTVNMLQGCRSVDEFERLNKIDEGTYGVVYRARDKKTGEIVALKKVKMEKERDGFPLTSLREINILLSFHHPSIVDVKEVVVGSNLDSIFMVMEYMEHDLKGLMESIKQPFSQSEAKCLMLQLLEGVKYLHDNWVLHRDLKTSNLLLNNLGELKICDFGLARQYGSPLKPYTHLVVTLWYR